MVNPRFGYIIKPGISYLLFMLFSKGFPKTRYVNYLKHNAQTLWNEGTDKNYLLYSSYWKNKPGATTDLTIQLSGAILIEAAAFLKEKKILQ